MNIPVATSYLFVYGLLRKAAPHPMARYLASEAEHISSGYINGTLYLVDDYPGLVLGKDNGLVLGDIYKIESQKLWKELDDFEGINNSDEYRSETVEVFVDRTILKSKIYLFNRSTTGLKRIWSGDFIEYLQNHPGLFK